MIHVFRRAFGRLIILVSLMGAPLTGHLFVTADAAEPTTLQFAGLKWAIKHGPDMGPGPNMWDRRNVWVDDQDRLHLLNLPAGDVPTRRWATSRSGRLRMN
jgi:hypothetical protein